MTGFVIRPLNAAGHVTARPMPPLRRPDYSFVYLISGEVLTDIGGHSYLLRGRDCALIPPSVCFNVKNHTFKAFNLFIDSFILKGVRFSRNNAGFCSGKPIKSFAFHL